MMNQEYIENLYNKFCQGILRPDELREWQAIVEDPRNEKLIQEIMDRHFQEQIPSKDHQAESDLAFERFRREVLLPESKQNTKTINRTFQMNWLKYAAILTVLLGFAITVKRMTTSKNETIPLLTETKSADIQAGSTQAILRSNNGEVLRLGERSDLRFTDGEILVENKTIRKVQKEIWHTLETPRASEYRMILSDGTRVFLNAGSKLYFPAEFSTNSREVRLEGEAFFEVAHDAKKPFHVTIENQRIEVLGTSFNINSYEKNSIKTTLITGRVKINTPNAELLLEPGQQALSIGNKLTKHNIDVNDEIAWTQARIAFSKKTIKQIAMQIERWYDVKFVFDANLNDVEKKTFSGNIARTSNLSEVLKIFTLTNAINYKIEGRTVYVKKFTRSQ